MAELADAQVSGACGVTPVWVQVPPLASSSARRVLRAVAPALLLAFAACSRFEARQDLEPADAILARHDGPAAAVDVGGSFAAASFAYLSGDGRTAVRSFDLSDRALKFVEIPSRGPERIHPPVIAAVDRREIHLAWRVTAPGATARLVTAGPPAKGDGFGPVEIVSQPVASNPRAGGRPVAIAAAEGVVPTPGSDFTRDLGVWSLGHGSASRIGTIPRVRTLGFAVTTLSSGAVIVGSLDRSGALGLARLEDGRETVAVNIDARPVGPAGVFLAAHGDAVLAGWTERQIGSKPYVAVVLVRSSDGGRTWSTRRELMRASTSRHPEADWATQGNRVAVTWAADQDGQDRIFMAVSSDFGMSFSPPLAVDSAEVDVERSRPRVSPTSGGSLFTWQERRGEARYSIRASLLGESGLVWKDFEVASEGSGRALRNPQAWLLEDGSGGVLWESHDLPPDGPGTTSPRPPGVSLHLRRLNG